MEDSILLSVKKVLGVAIEDEAFDLDILTAINTILMAIRQFGVGKQETFNVVDANSKWSDFADKIDDLAALKTYVELRVRLIFDPPSSSTMIDVIKETIKECEWRIYITENYNEPHEKESEAVDE